MTCPRCRAETPVDAEFCPECGASLTAVCPRCGTANAPGHKFCKKCGQPLAHAAAPGPGVAPTFPSPESYTPRHLTERILTSRSALEGERKQVTVLFADLKGSMELLADRDPEEVRKLFDPLLQHMMEAVHRYEGTVNQVMGDGIMALFGAPLAHEDHAVRACYAALRMQESVRRYAEAVRRTEGISLQVRVGVNSGEVVVRSIGSDLRMDYTAVGQTTHLAARMEQMATPGSILMTQDTLNLTEGYVMVNPLGPVPVKGLEAPIEVYEVTGAATVRSRLHAAAARGLTRFVGRDAEIEQLRQALERARAGHGQVVGVLGEPGVGKSRLFWEFTHSPRTQGCVIVESSSVSYGKAAAFLPIIELLRAYFQIEGRDEARKIREKITGRALSLERQLEPFLPAFLWLLDAPVEDGRWDRLDPAQRRQRTLDGVKRLLLRESQVQPLVVLFEDLHWIDAETQALLDGLVESLPTARLLLLVNYRPEYQHAWGSKTYYRQLRIDPLPLGDAEELLRSVLGEGPGLEPLKRLLIDRTEGNPFFLEESVRALVETKILTGDRGAYRLATTVRDLHAAVQIPATASAMLAARIDRLSPDEKRVLQAASVIGKDVPLGLLQAIADLPEDGLRRALMELRAAEFLYEARLFPDLEYTFKHALTHEVAYAGLLRDRRRALHARVVHALERLYPDRRAEHIEQLAHHALRGELWEEAVPYLRGAGAKALARSTHRDAAAWFEQALAALTQVPETRERREQAVDLLFDLRNCLFPLAEFERVAEHLGEAERLATALDDPRRLAWAWAYRCSHLWMVGRPREALALAERTQAAAATLGDFGLTIAATFYRGQASVASGEYRGARGLFRQTVEALAGELTTERLGHNAPPAVLSSSWLAFAAAECGDFDEGSAHGKEGLRIAEALDHPFSVIVACRGLGHVHAVKGEVGEALRVLERGLALCREWNVIIMEPFFQASLGHVYALSGRLDEGLASLQQALAATEATGAAWNLPLLLVYHAEACVRANRPAAAVVSAERALRLAQERGQRDAEAYTLRIEGEIAAGRAPSDLAQAEERYRRALARARELGMRPLVAHCHMSLGALYGRQRERRQARDELATATAMYREMGMRFWLEQAEAASRDLA